MSPMFRPGRREGIPAQPNYLKLLVKPEWKRDILRGISVLGFNAHHLIQGLDGLGMMTRLDLEIALRATQIAGSDPFDE